MTVDIRQSEIYQNLKREELPLLTALRFVAASHVVMFHYLPHGSSGFLASLVAAGPYSVTFFFVLSGFVLTYSYSGENKSAPIRGTALQFWVARLGRILPAYWLALLIALPLFGYSALVSKVTSIEVFLLGLLLVPVLLQSFVPLVTLAWNAPAWSLSVEAVFYALFPVLSRIAQNVRPTVFLLGSVGFALSVASIQGHFKPGLEGTDAAWNFYKFFPLFRLPAFVYGMALGRFFLFGWSAGPALSNTIFLASCSVLIFAFGSGLYLSTSIVNASLIFLLIGGVVYGGARPSQSLLKLCAAPPLVQLGHASYGIYILHVPLMFWWVWFFHEKGQSHLRGSLEFGLFFVFLVLFSFLSLYFVEIPVRRNLKLLGTLTRRCGQSKY